MITAHGGANGTWKNSIRYLNAMRAFPVDAIEVDVRKKGNMLFTSHLFGIITKKKMRLRTVFDYIKERGIMVNCDLKNRGIVQDVVALAKQKGVEHLVYFTGWFYEDDVKKLEGCSVYLNGCFYAPLKPSVKTLPLIKQKIDALNNPRIKGININIRKLTDEMIVKAKEIGLGLSVYTVDKEKDIIRMLNSGVDNVTTNKVSKVYKINNRIKDC